jgi:hypothetical protein
MELVSLFGVKDSILMPPLTVDIPEIETHH